MTNQQREQNPDVNSYNPDMDPAENPEVPDNPADRSGDIERKPDSDVIPVPPDVGQTVPIEEPPRGDDAPVGDVDDSPKRIA